jgi:hypothetical protein
LRPLPIADPGSRYALSYEADLDGSGTLDIADPFGYPEFRRLRAAVRDQTELMAISYSSRIDITYGSDLEMEKLHRQYVSGWMFSEFGLKPALGRLLTQADDVTPGAHP